MKITFVQAWEAVSLSVAMGLCLVAAYNATSVPVLVVSMALFCIVSVAAFILGGEIFK